MSNKKTSAKSQSNKKIPTVLIALIIVIGVIVLVGGIFVAIQLLGNKNDYTIPPEYEIEYPDVEQYYNENSTVIDIIPVRDSNDVFSEKDVARILDERGFSGCEITTSFSIDGEYNDDKIITGSSSDKHPMYQAYYLSENNELWTIVVIEGVIMAYPVSYNMENTSGIPVAVSESEEIISYDCCSNSFYRTIPNHDTLDVRVINKIDVETLESLTVEVLANG